MPTLSYYSKAVIHVEGVVLWFLHSPFCRAEGLCQHVAFKEGLVQVVVVVEMLNGPMRAKQVNRSSSVIG